MFVKKLKGGSFRLCLPKRKKEIKKEGRVIAGVPGQAAKRMLASVSVASSHLGQKFLMNRLLAVGVVWYEVFQKEVIMAGQDFLQISISGCNGMLRR